MNSVTVNRLCHCAGSVVSGQPGIGKSSLAIHIAHEVRKSEWNVIFVDAQNLEFEADFCTELLRNMKPYLPKDKQTTESALVSEVMQLIEQIDCPCIILDGCDRALAPENNSKPLFLDFLWKIPKAVQKRFMIVVTSCRRAQFLSLQVLEIHLCPLGNEDADHLLKSCYPYEFRHCLKESTIVSIRELCQGVPILIRLAGGVLKKYREAISQEEIVEKLRAKPLKMFKAVSASAPEAFIATIYNLISPSLKLYLHGVALFIGPFTRVEGARVFGLKQDGVQFGIDVIGPLQEYSLLARSSDNDDVSGDETQYRLHSLFRKFLLGLDFKTPEFQAIQEKYCVMQLGKIAEVQRMYDRNPQRAILLCQMYGFSNVIGELASVLRKVVETSFEVWKRFVALASCPNSWMSHCFGKELRKKFLKVCLGVALKRNLSVVEMNIRLILTDVLLQLNEEEAASSGLEKVHTKLSSIHVPKEPKEMLEVRYCLTEAKCRIAKNEGQKAAASLANGIERFSWAKEQPDYYTALGNACKCYRDYNGAISNYRKALERCETKFRKSQSPGFHPDISYLLLNIGHCQFCSAQFSESYESFSTALEMQRYLRISRLWLATTFYHLGICQASQGKQSEALDQFEQVYDLLGDKRSERKGDQSAVYLLTRQAHAKLLYTQGIGSWKSENNPCLRKAASDLQDLLKPLLDHSEMLLIWAESHALLVVIHCLLSDKKRALNHHQQLGQRYLDQELVSRCSVLSYVKNADIKDDSELRSSALKRRLSVTFHCYVGGRLMAASEGRERASSDVSRLSTSSELEASFEGQLPARQQSPIRDHWEEYDRDDNTPGTASTELSTENISGELTHLGGSQVPPEINENPSQFQPCDMGGAFSPAMFYSHCQFSKWSAEGNLN
ncbi:uncharacterized protein [Oscarella lobularis]|uniref:uncharacterized protein n=1 Tax=Oscarella lobularis TaxID=121494 RepID=UPI003313FB7A